MRVVWAVRVDIDGWSSGVMAVPKSSRKLFCCREEAEREMKTWGYGRHARLVKITIRPKKQKSLGEFAREAFLRAGGGWHNHTCVPNGLGLPVKTGDDIWTDFAAAVAAEVRRRDAK